MDGQRNRWTKDITYRQTDRQRQADRKVGWLAGRQAKSFLSVYVSYVELNFNIFLHFCFISKAESF
jgi:hypothetical protein